MRLHYLVKLKIRVFVKLLMLEKQNSRNFLLTSILFTENDATFWVWHHIMANLIKKTYTELYQNRPRFVKGMTKTFWCVFGSQF